MRDGIGRREDLALEDAEVDLDLIEPAGVDRYQPWTRLSETGDGGLTPMRTAAVEHPKDAPRRAIRLGAQ